MSDKEANAQTGPKRKSRGTQELSEEFIAREYQKYREVRTVRPDDRGRIPVAGIQKAGSDVAAYKQYVGEGGEILLVPIVEVPAREMWLYRNPKAAAMLREGIEDGKAGKIGKPVSFAEYLDADVDE